MRPLREWLRQNKPQEMTRVEIKAWQSSNKPKRSQTDTKTNVEERGTQGVAVCAGENTSKGRDGPRYDNSEGLIIESWWKQ